MDHKHQLTLKQALNFLFAGNSTFIVKSRKTGKRYTFKVKGLKDEKVKGNDKPYFVSFLNGSDNNSDYQFLGTIFSSDTISYNISKKSRIRKTSTVNRTFKWVLRTLLTNNSNNFEKIEFWHEGRCGKCGRKLTDPVSIEAGFGPHCRSTSKGELKQKFREKRLSILLDE